MEVTFICVKKKERKKPRVYMRRTVSLFRHKVMSIKP
jgi:hypothetical protein